MLPNTKEGNEYGIDPTKSPDFLIDGIAFDCYSPKTLNMRTIYTTITEKTSSQARSIILNLEDFPGTLDDLVNQLYSYPIQTLDELIAIKGDKIVRFVIN